jgi:hypothetical protein
MTPWLAATTSRSATSGRIGLAAEGAATVCPFLLSRKRLPRRFSQAPVARLFRHALKVSVIVLQDPGYGLA